MLPNGNHAVVLGLICRIFLIRIYQVYPEWNIFNPISEYALSGKTKTSVFNGAIQDLERDRVQRTSRVSQGVKPESDPTHDFHIFLFNRAILFFHQRLYEKAVETLLKLRDGANSDLPVSGTLIMSHNL